MAANVYYEADADGSIIRGKKVAIIGYGSQGHAHALNLKDSGVDVAVGLRPGSSSAAKAEAQGLTVKSVADAAAWADLVMILAPDTEQKRIYDEGIAAAMTPGKALAFAHGFNIRFGRIAPPEGVDVIMIASLRPEAFTPDDAKFAEAVARWVGAVAHRAELVQEIERNALEQGRRVVAEELITVLAHDLRNYISTIEFRIRAIRRKAELERRDAEVRDSDAALRSVGRLGSLVSDILDAARIDQGVLELEPRPVELTPLVEEVIDTLSTAQHRIETKVSEDLLVAADPKRVCQCLENILSNAVQHSPDEAPVTVFIRRVKRENDDVARIDIVDEGPGIDPDLLPRIFTGDASVLDETALLWPLFALMQPLNGAVFALDGILIGAGDGPFLALSMVGAFVACASVLVAVLVGDWGIRGVWTALVVLILVRLTAMLARFRRGRWLVTGWA